MTFLHIFVVALVQGATEFLPISSSGHLVLIPAFTGWPDQGLLVDVAAHVGTLGAVVVYFWRDLFEMLIGILGAIKGERSQAAKLALYIIIATLPAGAAGFLFNHYMPEGIRIVAVIGWTTLGYGLLLFIADKLGMTMRRLEHMKLADAVIIGLAQVLSLVPGTSRSGITMTAGRILGMERTAAARFSFLLSAPTIAGAALLKGRELYQTGDTVLITTALATAGLAFFAGLAAIAVMMAWLKRATFTPFVVYRILLGLFLLTMVYGWPW